MHDDSCSAEIVEHAPARPSDMNRNITDFQLYDRRIMISFVLVSLFILTSKFAGATKEVTIAWRYGVGEIVDGYVFVFNLVNWPISIWLSVLTVVLVPLIAKGRQENSSALAEFRCELLGMTLVLSVILFLFSLFVLPYVLKSGWTGLSHIALKKALKLAPFFSILIIIGFIINLYSVWLLAYGKYYQILIEAIPAITLCIALIIPDERLQEPLLWGTITGYILQLIIILTSLKQKDELYFPRFTFRSTFWIGFWSSMGIMGAGQTLTATTSVIDQFFASDLGPGNISILSYANRLLAFILGLGALAISRATLPVFSEIQSKQKFSLYIIVMRWAKWMFLMSFIVGVAGWYLSPYVVKILFERGSFSISDTKSVYTVLRYSLLQLPFYFPSIVLVSALSSQRKYLAIASIATLNLPLKLILNFLLVIHFQLNGLVIATALMYAFSMVSCFTFFRLSK